ncbi:nitroreductase [Nanoarchaeota archaeon]
MNETIKTIYSRRAVRKYKDKAVDKEIVDQIIDAGRNAPSAMNRQLWKFFVVSDKEMIKAISLDIEKLAVKDYPHLTKRKEEKGLDDVLFYGAPVVVFIAMPKDYRWAGMDVGMCVQNMMLASKSLGLDTCPIGLARFINETDNLEKLGVDPTDKIEIAIAIGYGDEVPGDKEIKKENVFYMS